MIGQNRVLAGWISLVVSSLVFAGKLVAYWVTDSAAVFSDAMESTVNVVAASLLVFSLTLAARPPDPDHPYGHGKVEFFSAGIEGALIFVAALLIAIQSVRALIAGPHPQQLETGMVVLVACSVVNAGLAFYLIRTGKEQDSLALVADGRHVLTDVWTTAGVVGGLLAVRFTGWVVLDPLIAIAVAANVVRTGWELTREAVGGLMDEADVDELDRLAATLEAERKEAWVDVHGLRTWRSGARLHLDLHMSVPRYFDVEQVHAIHDRVAEVLLPQGREGDIVVHFDPCTAEQCAGCVMSECSIRAHAFARRQPIDRARATRDDDAAH